MERGVGRIPETRRIGSSDLMVSPVGLGAWAWGSKFFWSYGRTHSRADLSAAWRRSLELGVNLVDTAEIYGNGRSERIIGELLRERRDEVVIATKYMPVTLTSRAIRRAAEGSLRRLGIKEIDLYQVHFPYPLHTMRATMREMERLVREGKVRYIGVSNFSAAQVEAARAALAREDVVSDQVHYNLIHRRPELVGLTEYARRERVGIIAYSPLAQGVLTDKYGPHHRPGGMRRFMPKFSNRRLARVAPLVGELRRIGISHGRTTSQVALAWLLRDPNVVVIPGAKNAEQAALNAGAAGLVLSAAELEGIEGSCRDCGMLA